jgi:hypothetical protein
VLIYIRKIQFLSQVKQHSDGRAISVFIFSFCSEFSMSRVANLKKV